MGNCAWFGAVRADGLPRGKVRRESERVAVLSGGELDRGRRATMWVSPQCSALGQQKERQNWREWYVFMCV